MVLLSLVAAMFSGAAVTPGTIDTQTDNLIEIFRSSCMTRQMKLSVSEAKSLKYDELPEGLPLGRDQIGRPLSADVWQLNAPGRTFAYILKFHEVPGVAAESICGVVSDKLKFETARNWVLAKSTSNEGELSWPMVWNMEEGYLLQAVRQKAFIGFQVNWSSEAERDRLLLSQH